MEIMYHVNIHKKDFEYEKWSFWKIVSRNFWFKIYFFQNGDILVPYQILFKKSAVLDFEKKIF